MQTMIVEAARAGEMPEMLMKQIEGRPAWIVCRNCGRRAIVNLGADFWVCDRRSCHETALREV